MHRGRTFRGIHIKTQSGVEIFIPGSQVGDKKSPAGCASCFSTTISQVQFSQVVFHITSKSHEQRAAIKIPTKADVYYFTFTFAFIFNELLKQKDSVSSAEFVISLFFLPLKLSADQSLSHGKMI